MFAINYYTDVVAAVAKKQQVLTFILQGLVRTGEERETFFADFVAENEEVIKAMPHEIATDSDVMDFCDAKQQASPDSISLGHLIDKCLTQIWEGSTLTDEQKASFNKDLWDTLSDELISLINARYELFKVEGNTDAH